jgi:hypothetical protein
VNKLQTYADNYQFIREVSDVYSMFYQFIEKDLIKEMMTDYSLIQEVNAQFMKHLKNKCINEIKEGLLIL